MPRLAATFVSLQERNFRNYFAGYVLSETGEWAQRIGQAWLVLELTGSGTLLGSTVGLQLLPVLLLGPYAGVCADRVDRRRLLVVTQAVSGLLALSLAVLTHAELVAVWMVMSLAFLGGLAKAFGHPARLGFVADMVGRDRLANAVTLNGVVFNVAKVVGPAVAGLLIARVGIAASFYLNAASYVALLLALLLMDRTTLRPTPRQSRQPGQLRSGLRYVAGTPDLLAPLVVLTVVGTFIFVWSVTLPIYARDVFQGGAETFGLMFSAMGVGAIVGGLAVAGFLVPTMRWFTAMGALLGTLTIVAALVPTLQLALISMVLLGGAGTAFRATGIAVVQVQARDEMRGRIMGIVSVALLGTTPVGGPIVGWMAELVGIRWVLGVAGALTLGSSLLAYAWLRGGPVRRARVDAAVAPELAHGASAQTLAAIERPPTGTH